VRRLERGTVGFRLTPTKVVAKRKLSQNRPDEVVDTIITQLEAGAGPYADARLADEMRRAHDAPALRERDDRDPGRPAHGHRERALPGAEIDRRLRWRQAWSTCIWRAA
jgi:hypothetical protein